MTKPHHGEKNLAVEAVRKAHVPHGKAKKYLEQPEDSMKEQDFGCG